MAKKKKPENAAQPEEATKPADNESVESAFANLAELLVQEKPDRAVVGQAWDACRATLKPDASEATTLSGDGFPDVPGCIEVLKRLGKHDLAAAIDSIALISKAFWTNNMEKLKVIAETITAALK